MLEVVQEVVVDGSDVNGPILDHIYSPWSCLFSCFTLKHELRELEIFIELKFIHVQSTMKPLKIFKKKLRNSLPLVSSFCWYLF